ncbi:response regulator [Salegentibacter flavus]|uniref:Response regulator receiver domain-containing protein n=1 Tax=Salegentibacter flavus TaxID=287099 RepID=A0A1I4ZII9_9FLAO|nr:response regulator [Salegentibacter flavus]SFN50072.1 Response regulator receiver domain-containing protein [Salegentibacter flavus]
MINEKLSEILLIDDDKILNFVNLRLLEKEGFTSVVCFSDAREALEYMKINYMNPKSEHDENPVLIFLDLNMPHMNGWEFLEVYDHIKDRFINRILIIILTSSSNPDDVERAEDHGDVVAFLNKPLTLERVSQVLSRYVQPKKP